MSGVLYEVQEYANMLQEREQVMENGARYNDLGELNAAIDQKHRELFGEPEQLRENAKRYKEYEHLFKKV